VAFHGQALQGGRVKEALIRSDDGDSGDIAVVNHQARRRSIAGKMERQEGPKGLARAEFIGEQLPRCGRGAGLVSPSLLVFQVGSRISCALADSPGYAGDLDCRDPIAGPGNRVHIHRRDAPIVEAPGLTGRVEPARKEDGYGYQGCQIECHKQAQEPAQPPRGRPSVSYRGNGDANRQDQDEQHGCQEEEIGKGHREWVPVEVLYSEKFYSSTVI